MRNQPDSSLNGFASYLGTERGLMHNTVQGYLRDVRPFLEFLDGRKISHAVVNAYVVGLYGRLKTNTLCRRLAVVRVFVSYLAGLGLVDGSLLQYVDPVRRERKTPRPISLEQFEGMVHRVHGESGVRNRAIAELMIGSGLRADEVCSLQVKDLSIQGRYVRVRGKGGKDRLSPVSPRSLPHLLTYVTEWRPLHATPGEPALFIQLNGRRMKRREMSHIVSRLGKKVGLTISAHTLRHTFATTLLNAGVDLDRIREWMGHATLNTTQGYLAVSSERTKALMRRCHPAFQESWGTSSNSSA